MGELIWVIPLSLIILMLMIVMGVTLIGVITGNIGMIKEMIKFFKL